MSGKLDKRTLLRGMGVAAVLSFVPHTAWAQAASIDIGTMGVGSSWYQYGVQLSQYIQGELPEGSVVNVRPYAAADGNLRLIEADDRIQLGMTFSTNISWALNGMSDISDATADNVRLVVAGLDQYYVGMAASADKPYDTLSEALEQGGVRISTLAPGSLGEITTGLLLQAHGMDEAALEANGGSVTRAGIQAASEAAVTGRSDVWINPISVGHPRMTELAISNDIKLLGLSEEAMAQMEDFGYRSAVLPAGSFEGQDSDITLPGASTALIVNADMDEETVYQITKAIIDNIDAIKADNASLSALSLETAADSDLAGGLPLHPGAQRAYEEAGVL